jgi:hypothetical protein
MRKWVRREKFVKVGETLQYYLFSLALQPSPDYGLLVYEVLVITHSDVPQLV